jgi:hypothetical protein
VAARKSDFNRSNGAIQLKQSRTEKLAQIRSIIAKIEPQLQKAVEQLKYQKRQHKLLDSVSRGLYEEIDKLAKKAPAEPITELVLSEMNQVIRETKELAIDDSYVQRLQEFIPAGDNPQHRDAVVVLRQVRDGLDRFKDQYDSDPHVENLRSHLYNAKGLEMALQLYLEGNESVSVANLEDHGTGVDNTWVINSKDGMEFGNDFNFGMLDKSNKIDFLKLDQVDISTCFAISNE